MLLALAILAADVSHAPGLPRETLRVMGAVRGTVDPERGMELARRMNRPVMMVFGCNPALEQGPLSDPDVVEAARRFVVVFVDAERHPALLKTYNVRALPKVLFLTPDGAVAMEFVGRGAAHHYLDAMLRILKILRR